MKNKKFIGYILIFGLFFYLIFIFMKDENLNYKIIFNNNDLDIILPNEVFLKSYEIKDYDKNELGEYKKLLEREVYKDMKKVRIENISEFGIKPNHAYFYTMFQEDDKNPNRRLKSLGFCITKDLVRIQKSRESDSNFIKICKQSN